MYIIKKTLKNDRSAVNQLLQNAGLPLIETTDDTSYLFKAINSDEEIIGAIGLEIYGQYGLLRSLVVSDKYRNQGIAESLVNQIEQQSAALKLKEVYLLTTTADNYFEKKGFMRIHRDKVQPEITTSKEFSNICPVSAVIMHKAVN